jgi:hypothetical protein
MSHYQRSASVVAAALVWLGPASAAPIDPLDELAEAGSEARSVPADATWILVNARKQAQGTSGLSAIVFGVAQERGRSRPATLRVDCFDGLTTVHVYTVGLGPSSSAMVVRYSLDGGRYVSVAWQASVDGSDLELSADRAIAFLTDLYGRTELSLAIVRPLSVPFLVRFAVGGAEQRLQTMAEECHWSAGPSFSGL